MARACRCARCAGVPASRRASPGNWPCSPTPGSPTLQPPKRRLILLQPDPRLWCAPCPATGGKRRRSARPQATSGLDPAHRRQRAPDRIGAACRRGVRLASPTRAMAGRRRQWPAWRCSVRLWLATRSWRITSPAIMLTTLVAGLIVTTALGLLVVGAVQPDLGRLHPAVRARPRHRFRHPARRCASRPSASAGDLIRSRRSVTATTALGAARCCSRPGRSASVSSPFCRPPMSAIAELGIIAGMGMIVALAAAAPPCCRRCSVLLRARRRQPEAAGASLARPGNRCLSDPPPPPSVLGWFCVSMAVSIALLPFVRFDFNPLHLRNVHGEAMATLDDLMHDPDRNPNVVKVLASNLPSRARAVGETRQAARGRAGADDRELRARRPAGQARGDRRCAERCST